MNHTPTSTLARLRALLPKRSSGAPETLTIAELQAALLLQLTDATDAPVPTQILTDLPRIELAVDPHLPASGMSYWTGTAWRLVARGGEHPNRQRFSLVHEFKHVIDHPVRDLLYANHREREQAADHFAACVLMPKIMLTRAWCSGLQDVHDLARHFAVSPQAMRRRLIELGFGEPESTVPYTCRRGLRTAQSLAIAGGTTAPGGPQ